MKKIWGFLPALLLALPAQALESIAQDPHDSTRLANETLGTGTGKIGACVNAAQSSSTQPCAVACQIRVPTVSLTTADSCVARTWTCQWPKQAVATNNPCPPGWSGSIGLDKIYEVRNCGSALRDTGQTSTTSVHCTRTPTETSTTTCPTEGDWTGSGITYTRPYTESLNLDLATTTSSTSAAWSLASVDCIRTVYREDYATCPGATFLCSATRSQLSGKQLSTTCPGGKTPSGGNVSITAITQKLANDLLTPQTTATGSPSATVIACSACTPGNQTFANPGTSSFKVPPYSNLVVEVWGGGGGGVGEGAAYSPSTDSATSGETSHFGGMVIAGGGVRGYYFEYEGAFYLDAIPGNGGGASGGDVNIAGSNGNYCSGGGGANGGAGGGCSIYAPYSAGAGSAPGGGGGGHGCYSSAAYDPGPGAGGGGYARKTFAAKQLPVGNTYQVVVGRGGTGGLGTLGNSYCAGANGASGLVKISWTCN